MVSEIEKSPIFMRNTTSDNQHFNILDLLNFSIFLYFQKIAIKDPCIFKNFQNSFI